MADLKKILSKLKEESLEGDGFEQLSDEESSALEGGSSNSGCPSNRTCPVNHNATCPPGS